MHLFHDALVSFAERRVIKMIKRKLCLALLVTVSALFVACSNANSKKTEEQEITGKQSAASSEDVSSEEATQDKSATKETTTDQPTSDRNASLDMIQPATISETEGILTLEMYWMILSQTMKEYFTEMLTRYI